MWKKMLATAVLAMAAMGAMAGSAHASGVPEVTADPAAISVGERTTVTATDLGGLETAFFGLGSGGSLIDPATGAETTTVEAPVTNGTATVEFTSAEPGDFVVAVGNGETPLAQVTVTVSAAATPTSAPTPTVTVTQTVEPTPEPTMTTLTPDATDAGIPLWAIILIVVLAVLVIGGIVTIIVLVARRRRGEGTGPA